MNRVFQRAANGLATANSRVDNDLRQPLVQTAKRKTQKSSSLAPFYASDRSSAAQNSENNDNANFGNAKAAEGAEKIG